MAFLSFANVAIRGISACVPPTIEENNSLPFYKKGEAEQVIAGIGIERRHICKNGETTTDLCFQAAKQLLTELKWDIETIDLIAFVTQTPDYLNHPNSFVVHERLGLPQSCMCLDLYHGCPGWVVGLNTVCSLVSNSINGGIKRALLFDGDQVSAESPINDREGRPLFGDCGTVTALEFDENAKPMYFSTITKSKDGEALIRKDGGYKYPFTIDTLQKKLDNLSGKKTVIDIDEKMDSMDVFSFAITTVPKSIKQLCSYFDIKMEMVDKIVFHQANKFMLQTIAKRLKLSEEKVPLSLKNYGNTTSASIPLTIVSECSEQYKNPTKTVVSAFGTGLACASAYFETDCMVCPKVTILKKDYDNV